MEQEQIRVLEEQRKRVLLLYGLIGAIGVLGVILLRGIPIAGIVMLVGALCLYVFLADRQKKKYAVNFKKLLVEEALCKVFTDVVFQPEVGLDSQVIKNTEMMNMGNRYFSDDYIRGKYKGIPFEQADVQIQQVTSTGKTTTTVTYFSGRWMIFEFNKNFSCELQVREKGFRYAKKTGGWFGKRSEMNALQMEDVQFNKEFSVYAVNAHEAYYILTPHMMDNIRKLKACTQGQILLCFVDNRMHVALNNSKNAFEPPIFSAIQFEQAQNKIYAEINVITRFVDEMDLDHTIFK